jgi:hypothetical protein
MTNCVELRSLFCYLPVHKRFAYVQYIVYRGSENSNLQTTQTDSLLRIQKKFSLDKNYLWIRDGSESNLQKTLPVFELTHEMLAKKHLIPVSTVLYWC